MKSNLRLFLLSAAAGVFCLAQTGAKSGIDRSAFDTTCKPCDDFWRYANGTWLDQNPIPAQYSAWGHAYVLREANRERLKTILEAAAATQTGDADTRRIGDFYASCLDTAAIDAAGAKPLDPQLKRLAAVQTRPDLAAVLLSLEKEGGLNPTSFDSRSDLSNTEQMIAALVPNRLSLPDRDYYFNSDDRTKTIRQEFTGHVQRTLQLLGDSAASSESAARTILDFETTLAQALLTNVDRRDPYKRFHKMDLAQLEKLAPNYNWRAALQELGIAPGGPIDVVEPEFVKAVDTQLAAAPLATWKTWLRWRLIADRSPYLSRPFYDEWFRFHRTVLSGVKEPETRWKVCVSATDEQLGEALGKIFVAKHFPPEAKRRMTALVENLRVSLREAIQQADWLEPATRTNALRKLDAFDARIGYPVKWRDYGRVRVTRSNYLASTAAAALESRRFELAKIGKKADKTEWNMTPPTVNAYYNSARNSITFPAGILQPPFFIMDADDAVNYGAIGAIIGHEMGHGFDDQGSKFDADGNLKNWWTDEDRKKFEDRAACIVEQFDSIDVGEGLRHKGRLVTGEALGDLGGVRIAYQAYRRSLQGKEAPVLDGFTGDQRFFLAFARTWATQFRPESTRLLLNTDPHPLPHFRADATLQNVPEFQKAFSCRPGDAMVRPPEKQCRLW